jgi:ethanolamine ammonia-lyase large subunit
LRETLGLRPAPEFEAWLQAMGVMDDHSRLLPPAGRALQLAAAVTPGQ